VKLLNYGCDLTGILMIFMVTYFWLMFKIKI